MTGQNNDSPAAAPGSNTLSHFGQTSMDREIAEISEAMKDLNSDEAMMREAVGKGSELELRVAEALKTQKVPLPKADPAGRGRRRSRAAATGAAAAQTELKDPQGRSLMTTNDSKDKTASAHGKAAADITAVPAAGRSAGGSDAAGTDSSAAACAATGASAEQSSAAAGSSTGRARRGTTSGSQTAAGKGRGRRKKDADAGAVEAARALGMDEEDEDSFTLTPQSARPAQTGKTRKKGARASGRISVTTTVEEDFDESEWTVVQVAINRALYQTYDYRMYGRYGNEIIGCRVHVSFGYAKGNKEVGVITATGAMSGMPVRSLKECSLIDAKPVIVPDVMQTLLYAAAYYHYPVGQTVPVGLPAILRDGGHASYREIPGLALTVPEDELEDALKKLRSVGQKELLMALRNGPRKNTDLREQGWTSAQGKALIKKGMARAIDFAHDLQPYDLEAEAAADNIIADKPFILNDEQQAVLEAINSQQGYGVFLLNGVTGSGKTEVYLQAIEHTLRQGKRALVMVPEIALTPQTFKRFYQRFKVPVATIHSGLSDRERLDAFLDMYTSRAAILIGTRSALFTPVNNLGLIVIDEEHDSSFKQGDGLRYHARTLAVYRARLNNCVLLLGSATPSLESVHYCQLGFFRRLDLVRRAQKARLPRMHLIDLRADELNENVLAGVGEVVEKAVGIATAQHQQALLFLNRRGFSSALICPHCGYVVMCPKCDVALTVHKEKHQMCCHVCNSFFQLVKHCPYCRAKTGHLYPLIEIGVGTEQVAGYLSERFMDVGIERIDRDVITSKEGLDQSLQRILHHESEIIVGTQMLAKGHDFPDVTVVGILDVDGGLFCDDFRGYEYTAQLVTQVAGRAGRADKEGDVYIQTRHPDHLLLQSLVDPSFNYLRLACELLTIRKDKMLPPYTFQAIVMVNSTDRDLAFYTLRDIMTTFENRTDGVLNEVRPSIIFSDRTEKRFNRFHFHCNIIAHSRSALDRVLDEITTVYSGMKNLKDLRFAIDVDPVSSV